MEEVLFSIFNDYVEKFSDATVYGIFDGVKYPMLHSDLEEGLLTYDMLFREEELRMEMQEVAPFLVALDFTHEKSQEESKELMKCYGENGCIFLASKLDFEETLEAMRELFYVYTPEGDKGYMRFYAPNIFMQYIGQKDQNILYALFNDIEHYWCEDEEDVNTLVQYSLKNRKVIQTPLNLKKDTHES